MKFLKSTIAMVALFAIASVNAKVIKRQGQPVNQPVIQPVVKPIIQPAPQPELPVVDVKKKTFDTNYVENKVQEIIRTKGFVVKNESDKMRKNRLVGLVKNEIIQDLTPETNPTEMNALKHLVNTTMHQIIVNDIERALPYYTTD
jgi:hypothetical protein